jgi:hypothetical protein
MAGDKSSVKVTFLGDAEGLARAAAKARASLDGVGKSVKAGARAGAFLGSAAGNLATSGLSSIKNFAVGSVGAFAAIEDATGAASVQFGAALPQVIAFAETAADKLGMSKRAALDAANTFGTFGKGAGLTGNDLAGFSTKLTGLAGDLASFKGTTTEQAIEAVGAALRGETEPIRAYGVMLDAASVKAEALALGLVKPAKATDKIREAQTKATLAQGAFNAAVAKHGKGSAEALRAGVALSSAQRALRTATAGTIPELTQQQKVMATQSLIFKKTTDAQGDSARTANSTANTQKRLTAAIEDQQAKLGAKLAPAVTAARQAVLGLLRASTKLAAGIAATTTFIKDHGTAFTVAAGIVTALLIPTMVRLGVQYTVTAAKAVASAVRQVAAWVVAQAGALAAGVVYLATFALVVAGWVRAGAQAMLSAARMAAAWLIAMGPIAIVIAAVAGLVFLIIKHWDTIKRVTAAAFNWVWTKVKQVFGFLKTLFLNFTGPGLIIKHFDKIVGFVKGMPGRIKSAATGMFDGIKDAFKAAINWLIRKWNDFSIGIPAVDTHIPGIGKVGGFSLDTPNIPELAKGGIVKARPGGTIVKVGEAGRDEAVVPLNRGATGGGVHTIRIELTQQGRVMHTELLKLKRELGGNLGIA